MSVITVLPEVASGDLWLSDSQVKLLTTWLDMAKWIEGTPNIPRWLVLQAPQQTWQSLSRRNLLVGLVLHPTLEPLLSEIWASSRDRARAESVKILNQMQGWTSAFTVVSGLAHRCWEEGLQCLGRLLVSRLSDQSAGIGFSDLPEISLIVDLETFQVTLQYPKIPFVGARAVDVSRHSSGCQVFAQFIQEVEIYQQFGS